VHDNRQVQAGGGRWCGWLDPGDCQALVAPLQAVLGGAVLKWSYPKLPPNGVLRSAHQGSGQIVGYLEKDV